MTQENSVCSQKIAESRIDLGECRTTIVFLNIFLS